MQRKNYILKRKNHPARKRNAMAMIMAIAVIIIISTIMALSLSMTAESSKRTIDIYVHEQAILYSKSAAELALLDIAQEGCINNRNYIFGYYNVNVATQYIYTQATTNVNGLFNCPEFTTAPNYIITPEQNGSVLMDITVTINDPTIVSEPIRYFRRSIQKL